MEWLALNWEWILVAWYVLEKVVKLTPTKKDDIVFDMILKPVWNKFLAKRTSG